MTSKIYRTGQGKMIDMGALILQNEKVRAVGNMGVNARGDLIDDSGTVIDPKGNQVQKQFERQTKPVQAINVPQFKQPAPAPAPAPAVEIGPNELAALKALDAEFSEDIDVRVAPSPVASDPIVDSTTGIASAMKKAVKSKTDNL